MGVRKDIEGENYEGKSIKIRFVRRNFDAFIIEHEHVHTSTSCEALGVGRWQRSTSANQPLLDVS